MELARSLLLMHLHANDTILISILSIAILKEICFLSDVRGYVLDQLSVVCLIISLLVDM